jgi:regulator of protease activity HflC (stomatin/prohibitin superfamily)
MLTNWQFGLIFLGVFLLGGLLFFLTGFIRVYKGRVAIIERVGQFVGLYKPGIYYFAPILYRRVGMYRVGEIKEKYLINRVDYQITYEIEDVKQYHYVGHHDIEGILRATLMDSKDNLSEALIKRCKEVGVKFITLEKLKQPN